MYTNPEILESLKKVEETRMFPADRQEAVGRAAHPSQCEEDIPF